MSTNDLFGDSDNEAPPVVSRASTSPNRTGSAVASPVASSSRGSPRPVVAGSEVGSPAPEGDVDDLFADDDDEPPPVIRTRTASSNPTSRSGSAGPRDALEYDEEEGEEQVVQETWANSIVPTWNRLVKEDNKVWHLKLPAYVNIEPKPFDHSLYRAELDPEEAITPLTGLPAKGRMLGVKNTIRWRWVRDEQGNYKKQSNAKVIKWSDGSSSLQLGSDLFDIATPAGTTLGSSSSAQDIQIMPPSQSQSQPLPSDSQSMTYICAAIGTAGVLMAEAPLAGQLSLVPTSMNSKTHMELVRHVGQQHTKHSKLKILDEIIGDPDVVAAAAAAAGVRKRAAGAAKRRMPAGSGMGGGSKGRKRGGRRGGSEDESEDDGIGGGGRYKDYEDDGFVVDDSDESEDEGRGKKGKRRGSSDEEGEYRSKGGKNGGEGGGADGEKRRSGRKRKEEEEELDEIELAERDIEERERERKRAKTAKGSNKKGKKKSRDYGDSDEDRAGAKGKGKSKKEVPVPVEEDDAEGEEEDMDMDMDMDMDVESEEE